MDELIVVFLDTYFTEESRNEIYRSFSLFDKFDLKNYTTDLISIISNQSLADNAVIVDMVYLDINNKADYIIQQHKITLKREAELYQKNEILKALFDLQSLEDYTSVINVIESTEDQYIKLATILSDYCDLDMTNVLTIIDDYDIIVLNLLKRYIYNKESMIQPDRRDDTDLVTNLRLFKEFFGSNSLGIILVGHDILIGESFHTYLPYLDNIVTNDDRQTALNILSVIYLTPEGLINPLDTYRQYGLDLIHQLDKVSAIEVHFIDLISKFNEFKNAKHQLNKVKT